jgi:hypothetical protein
VPDLHRRIAKKESFRNAIESLTALPFDTLWPHFSLALLNRPTLAQFRQWDSLIPGARLDATSLPGVSLSLPPLSAVYLNVELDGANRDLRFNIPAANGIKVQVTRNSGDVYRAAEDWTSGGAKTLCGNPTPGTGSGSPAEAVVVVVTNSSTAGWRGTLGIQHMSCEFVQLIGPPTLHETGTRSLSGVNPCTHLFERRSWDDGGNISTGDLARYKYDGKWIDHTCKCDDVPLSSGAYSYVKTVVAGNYDYAFVSSFSLPNSFAEVTATFEADLAGRRRGTWEQTINGAGLIFPGCDVSGKFTEVRQLAGSDTIVYEERLLGSVTEEVVRRRIAFDCGLSSWCAVSFPQ